MMSVQDEPRFPRRPSQIGAVRQMVIRDVPVEMDVQGDGAPIVFVHGFPLDHTMWRPVIAVLSGWRRIAPDLRTVGVPLGERAPEGMVEYAADVAALLDALGVERAVVCGLSLGGYVAFELWRHHRDRVRALILCNTRAAADSEDQRRGRDELAALVQRGGLGPLEERMLPRLLAPESREALPDVVDHVQAMIRRQHPEGVVDALTAMKHRPDSRPLLPEIGVPTLVIAGQHDEVVPVAEARDMAAAIPDAHMAVIPGAGHLAPLEAPIATSRVMGEFLDALS